MWNKFHLERKKNRFFDFWPHDFDFAPQCVALFELDKVSVDPKSYSQSESISTCRKIEQNLICRKKKKIQNEFDLLRVRYVSNECDLTQDSSLQITGDSKILNLSLFQKVDLFSFIAKVSKCHIVENSFVNSVSFCPHNLLQTGWKGSRSVRKELMIPSTLRGILLKSWEKK